MGTELEGTMGAVGTGSWGKGCMAKRVAGTSVQPGFAKREEKTVQE